LHLKSLDLPWYKIEKLIQELAWRDYWQQVWIEKKEGIKQDLKNPQHPISNHQVPEAIVKAQTGIGAVDEAIKELYKTGYMHNRVRMVTAGFLCKHLLIDWRYGEAYFAKKLLDYELSSNNGNWQWAAGTGCDAAPYFRIFNPIEQLKKFDKTLTYTKKWVKDFDTLEYPKPIVDHKYARNRALEAYKKGIN